MNEQEKKKEEEKPTFSQEDFPYNKGHTGELVQEDKKNIVFLQPFPNFTKNEYDELIKKVPDATKDQRLFFNGFVFEYDAEKGAYRKDYQDYKEIFDDLLEKIKMHIKGLIKSHKNRVKKADINDNSIKDINIIILTLPKTPADLENYRKIISNLSHTDEIYLNSHGNMDLIGIGCLKMLPSHVYANLKHIGLLTKVSLTIGKKITPTIIVWSCNSGLNDCNPAFATLLHKSISREDKDVFVLGVKAFLCSRPDGSTYIATRNEKGKLVEMPQKPDGAKKLLLAVTTPKTKKEFLNKSPGGIFTTLSKVAVLKSAKMKKKLEKKNKYKARRLNFDEYTSEKDSPKKTSFETSTSSQLPASSPTKQSEIASPKKQSWLSRKKKPIPFELNPSNSPYRLNSPYAKSNSSVRKPLTLRRITKPNTTLNNPHTTFNLSTNQKTNSTPTGKNIQPPTQSKKKTTTKSNNV